MPRLQVYRPDDLFGRVKVRRLPASELLQAAVRAELHRLDLLAETDSYLTELIDEVGQPSEAQRARAENIARALAVRHNSPANRPG